MKKNLVRSLCLAIVLIMALLPVMASANGYYYVKTGNGRGLNVRKSAGIDGKVICSIPYRALVLVYEYSPNYTWAYIEADNPKQPGATVKGWVSTSYLVKNDPGPYKGGSGKVTEEPTFSQINSAAKRLVILDEPYKTVIQTKKITNQVHLRWFPCTRAAFSGEYYCNTEIRVLAISKTWAQVEVVEDGHVGYILADNVAPVTE